METDAKFWTINARSSTLAGCSEVPEEKGKVAPSKGKVRKVVPTDSATFTQLRNLWCLHYKGFRELFARFEADDRKERGIEFSQWTPSKGKRLTPKELKMQSMNGEVDIISSATMDKVLFRSSESQVIIIPYNHLRWTITTLGGQ